MVINFTGSCYVAIILSTSTDNIAHSGGANDILRSQNGTLKMPSDDVNHVFKLVKNRACYYSHEQYFTEVESLCIQTIPPQRISVGCNSWGECTVTADLHP